MKEKFEKYEERKRRYQERKSRHSKRKRGNQTVLKIAENKGGESGLET